MMILQCSLFDLDILNKIMIEIIYYIPKVYVFSKDAPLGNSFVDDNLHKNLTK